MTSVILVVAILGASSLGAIQSPETASRHPPTTAQTLAERGLTDELVVAPPGEPGKPGKLIAWDAQTSEGYVLGDSPDREVIAKIDGPENSQQLAVSSGGSQAFFTDGNRKVEVRRPDGTRRTLDIGHELGRAVWLDERRLAVSPKNGDHLVEIWDVESGELLQGVGAVPRISEAPGYRPLRSTELCWDPERHRLHLLDAFTGSYRVYDLSKPTPGRAAEPRIKAQIDDRAKGKYDAFIAQTDRQLVAQGQFQGASIWRFLEGLDSHGDAWFVERCDPAGDETKTSGGSAHLLAVDAEGAEHRFAVETPCCSLHAVPWGDSLVFARSATQGQPGCFASVPRPPVRSLQTGSFWLEGTPLSLRGDPRSRQSSYPPTVRQWFPAGAEPGSVAARVRKMAPGSVLLCMGGEDRAVGCTELWLDSDTDAPQSLDLKNDASSTGRAVTGRVSLGGAAVSGAAVSVVPASLRTTRLIVLPLAWPKGSKEPIRQIATDRDGRFTLPELAAGEYRLLVRLSGGRMDHSTTFKVTPPPNTSSHRRSPSSASTKPQDLGTLDFPVGLRLTVAVTDLNGTPIPGAQAGAAQPSPEGEEHPGDMTLFSVNAGGDGVAVLDGLAPDLRAVVTCQAPGYDFWRQEFDEPPVSVDCRVAPLARIAGRLVDEDGEPLAKGRVTLAGGSGFGSGAVEAAVVGAKDRGHFAFEGLEPASFQLSAASPGRAAKSLPLALEAGETRNLGDILLEPGSEWRCRVVDGSESEDEPAPIAGATLSAVSPQGSLLPATTDTEGEAQLEGPASGPLTLDVRAPGFAPHRVAVPESVRSLNAPPFEISLYRGGWVEAHVWDEKTGGPCAGCQIELAGSGPAQSLSTDSSGTARSEALAPGTWNASLARIQGYGTVVTRSGGDDVRTVTVTAGMTAEVRFGDPKETLQVVLSPPLEYAAWRLLVREASGALHVYEIDASGSATVRRPAGGAVLSLLGDGETIEVGTLPEDADDPTLVEAPTGVVTAQLPQDLGASGTGAEPLPLVLVNIATGRKAAEVSVRAGAQIRVPFLPDGVYALQAAGRTLATASVSGGGETDLGELR